MCAHLHSPRRLCSPRDQCFRLRSRSKEQTEQANEKLVQKNRSTGSIGRFSILFKNKFTSLVGTRRQTSEYQDKHSLAEGNVMCSRRGRLCCEKNVPTTTTTSAKLFGRRRRPCDSTQQSTQRLPDTKAVLPLLLFSSKTASTATGLLVHKSPDFEGSD